MKANRDASSNTRDTVCHLAGNGATSDIRINKPDSPAWAQSAGISWRAPEQTVKASREDAVVRLVLQDVTGDARAIEWNPSTLRVTLRRCELWSKPLYYYVGNGELLVSDSLRLVVKSLPLRPNLDLCALDAYLAVEFFPAPLTPFREIRKVGVEETCHIDLSNGTSEYVTGSMTERVATDFERGLDAMREALSEAMENRMRQCPDELVLLCSGGVDSTILAHLMRGRGRAIVLSYVNSWKDETRRARQAARHADLPLQEVQLPTFRADQLHRYAGLLDEPLGGTCGFAIGHLCASLPENSWIVAGHGSGALSHTNVNHRHLRDALASGPREHVVERFCRRVTYADDESRRMLLGYRRDPHSPGPVEEMIRRERPTQADHLPALLAVIRRQLCVAEEMTQIWPIYEAFGHTPVMPFFEPRVRSAFDRFPVSVLRNERYERRLLGELAARCPGYTPQPRQLGYGLPLGLPGYPDKDNMEEAVETFAEGPLSRGGLQRLLEACSGTECSERFHRLRRLWTALLLHAWLDRILETYPSSGSVRVV